MMRLLRCWRRYQLRELEFQLGSMRDYAEWMGRLAEAEGAYGKGEREWADKAEGARLEVIALEGKVLWLKTALAA
jgi:hypothetical protein